MQKTGTGCALALGHDSIDNNEYSKVSKDNAFSEIKICTHAICRIG
jgi:hypothetical protein